MTWLTHGGWVMQNKFKEAMGRGSRRHAGLSAESHTKNYAVGLEMSCPGGAYSLGP